MAETTPTVPETSAPAKNTLDVNQICQLLPHSFPFLLIDRVTNYVHKERITAIKNVTFNEPFFAGHFPGAPVIPGVLILEAIAQAGGALFSWRSQPCYQADVLHWHRAGPLPASHSSRRPAPYRGRSESLEDDRRTHGGYCLCRQKKVAEALVTCRLVDTSRARSS